MEGRIAIVTGGESGIGAACALALGNAGAKVVVTYFKDRDAALAVCAAIGDDSRATAVQVDVSQEASVATLFATVRKGFRHA